MSEAEFEHFDADDLARAREIFSSDRPGTKVHRTANGKLSAADCDTLRRRYGTGEWKIRDLASEWGMNHEVIRRHIRGMCKCDGEEGAVDNSVRYRGDRTPEQTSNRGCITRKVTPEMCASYRRRIHGQTLRNLADADEADVDEKTIGKHVRGSCTCDHDEPPRVREWVKDD